MRRWHGQCWGEAVLRVQLGEATAALALGMPDGVLFGVVNSRRARRKDSSEPPALGHGLQIVWFGRPLVEMSPIYIFAPAAQNVTTLLNCDKTKTDLSMRARRFIVHDRAAFAYLDVFSYSRECSHSARHKYRPTHSATECKGTLMTRGYDRHDLPEVALRRVSARPLCRLQKADWVIDCFAIAAPFFTSICLNLFRFLGFCQPCLQNFPIAGRVRAVCKERLQDRYSHLNRTFHSGRRSSGVRSVLGCPRVRSV